MQNPFNSFMFCSSDFLCARGIWAMDDREPNVEHAARGFRAKWRKTGDVDKSETDMQQQLLPFDFNPADASLVTEIHDSPVDANDEISPFAPGEHRSEVSGLEGSVCNKSPLWNFDLEENVDAPAASVSDGYEPSSVQDDSLQDVGGQSSAHDDAAAVSDLFIRGVKNASIVMPWELPLMKSIFGDLSTEPSLSMPMSWGDTSIPVRPDSTPSTLGPKIPSSCKWVCAKHVRYKTDENFIEQKSRAMNNATQKWKFLIYLDLNCSETGIQFRDNGYDPVLMESLFGVKSPSTIIKRANSITMFFRWHSRNGLDPFLPFSERDVWSYILSQAGNSNAATRSQGLLQALRFAHYVIGMHGALDCANSRRLIGQAQIQLSRKPVTKQARALTVGEVRMLHGIAEDETHSNVDRCIASNLLMMLYGRCRVSDVSFIHEILHDSEGTSGFVEISTRYHKSARSAQQKSLLLPIVIANAGLGSVDWLSMWIANRKRVGLVTSGDVQGALCPAPKVGDFVTWLKRPLSASEISAILKSFLDCDDPDLSSHSLKATTLSWAAKGGMSRDDRRILGRHSTVLLDSDSFYSRDLSFGPVSMLRKVIHMIKDGIFHPDSMRSNYFPEGRPATSATPVHAVMQPVTPVFQGLHATTSKAADAAGEDVDALHVDLDCQPGGGSDMHKNVDPPTDLKLEEEWEHVDALQSDQPIQVDSDTDSEASLSTDDSCDSDSADDDVDFASSMQRPGSSGQHVVLVRNNKSTVVHECKDKASVDVQTNEVMHDTMDGGFTACGRVINEKFDLVNGTKDWTALCRVCFKGRRGPAMISWFTLDSRWKRNCCRQLQHFMCDVRCNVPSSCESGHCLWEGQWDLMLSRCCECFIGSDCNNVVGNQIQWDKGNVSSAMCTQKLMQWHHPMRECSMLPEHVQCSLEACASFM